MNVINLVMPRQVRLKIGEIIADKTGNMLIIPIASLLGIETAERERNCAAMLGFKKGNIYIYRIEKQG